MNPINSADEWADQLCRELEELHIKSGPHGITPVGYALFLRKFITRIQAEAVRVDEKILAFAYSYDDHIKEIKEARARLAIQKVDYERRIEALEEELKPWREHQRTANLLVCHQGEESG